MTRGFFGWLSARIRELASQRALYAIVAAGTVLAATSVGSHLVLDDYVLLLGARGAPTIHGLPARGLELFSFTTGVPEDNRALMDEHLMLPWWTDPELRVAFFRPVSALSHQLDVALWPESPRLMHLQSLAWLALGLVFIGLLYRRLEAPPWLAGLAALLYAIDDVRGPTVAWLSNRNALVAVVFGSLALILHDSARQERRLLSRVAAPLCFGAAMLSAELAAGVLAYVVAYALVLDRATARDRALSVLPYALVSAVWFAAYKAGDYGVRGSGAYVDPFSDSVSFLWAAPANLVALLGAQLGGPPSDLVFLGEPAHRPIVLLSSAAVLLVFGALAAPILRRDPVARFWAVGMVLSAVVGTASFPSDRLLSFVSLGAAPLLARLLGEFVHGAAVALSWSARSIALLGLTFLHLAVAPALLPLRSFQMELFGKALDRATAQIPADESVTRRTAVIVNAPTVLMSGYLQGARAWHGVPRPAHLYVLASASSPIKLIRSGPSEIVVEPELGFLATPLDQHYRRSVRPEGGDRKRDLAQNGLAPGEAVRLTTMEAEVRTLTPDGRPRAVAFRFTRPLYSGDLLFLRWRDDRYEPFSPPPLGATVTFAPEDVNAILARAARRALFGGP